jgi:hypothetical protein
VTLAQRAIERSSVAAARMGTSTIFVRSAARPARGLTLEQSSQYRDRLTDPRLSAYDLTQGKRRQNWSAERPWNASKGRDILGKDE